MAIYYSFHTCTLQQVIYSCARCTVYIHVCNIICIYCTFVSNLLLSTFGWVSTAFRYTGLVTCATIFQLLVDKKFLWWLLPFVFLFRTDNAWMFDCWWLTDCYMCCYMWQMTKKRFGGCPFRNKSQPPNDSTELKFMQLGHFLWRLANKGATIATHRGLNLWAESMTSATPLEPWRLRAWVPLSGSAGWHDAFRQPPPPLHSRTTWADALWQTDTELHFSIGHLCTAATVTPGAQGALQSEPRSQPPHFLWCSVLI